MTKKPKVIIIGGGVSGLACAYKLAKTGKFEIHLLISIVTPALNQRFVQA